ncbi:ATP-dependent DNA ligase [Micromonospora echinofusca]|uniref:ATP-dependent DNA ligase n=1 Tax=Micromonospora echinofusca TaxID=47858 RepID=UPI0012FD21CA|nr:hypothetical protein [Micromonospora echinofusca]
MLAVSVDAMPEGPDLVYEPKCDGWRAIAYREADGVYLQSRAGRNLTPYFPLVSHDQPPIGRTRPPHRRSCRGLR